MSFRDDQLISLPHYILHASKMLVIEYVYQGKCACMWANVMNRTNMVLTLGNSRPNVFFLLSHSSLLKSGPEK